MDSFRVTPWKTYDPAAEGEPLTGNLRFSNNMDDVDMDAPQISTLRDDETPEPQPNPARTSKFRVKLVLNENKAKGSTPSAGAVAKKPAESDDDEDDEEEDQLIDDDEDDDEEAKPTVTIPSVAVTGSGEKRGGAPKRGAGIGSRGGRGRGGTAGVKRKASRPVEPEPVSTVDSPLPLPNELSLVDLPLTVSVPAAKKTKIGSAKGQIQTATAPPKPPRKRAPKQPKPMVTGSIPISVPVPPHMRDDAESVSEIYPGTAASSPQGHDEHTPEPPEHPTPSVMPTVSVSAPLPEDIVLDGIPLPQYPLPSKPFLVQPPPKIGTGFAPVIPLDKNVKPVRRWRQAQREIRGIAGGRWFIKSWIGDRTSEFANNLTTGIAQGTSHALGDRDTPSGLIAKISTLGNEKKGPGRPKGMKLGDGGTSAPSRASSTLPDAPTPSIPIKRPIPVKSGLSSTVETPMVLTPTPS